MWEAARSSQLATHLTSKCRDAQTTQTEKDSEIEIYSAFNVSFKCFSERNLKFHNGVQERDVVYCEQQVMQLLNVF